MSYDVSLIHPNGDPARSALAAFTCLDPERYPLTEDDEIVEVGNYTSNVSSMWHKALSRPLRELNGEIAGPQVELLAAAVAHMEANADEYRKNNSPNGWGNFEGAHDLLLRLLVACLRHPQAAIRIHS